MLCRPAPRPRGHRPVPGPLLRRNISVPLRINRGLAAATAGRAAATATAAGGLGKLRPDRRRAGHVGLRERSHTGHRGAHGARGAGSARVRHCRHRARRVSGGVQVHRNFRRRAASVARLRGKLVCPDHFISGVVALARLLLLRILPRKSGADGEQIVSEGLQRER